MLSRRAPGGLFNAFAANDSGSPESRRRADSIRRAAAGARDDLGTARIVASVEPDVKVDRERTGDLIATVCANRFTGYAVHHFTYQVAEGQRVITMPGAGHPPRYLFL